MKKLKRVLLYIIGVLLLFVAGSFATGKGYLVKSLIYNFADVDDYKKFHNDEVATTAPQPWPIANQYNKVSLPPDLASHLDSTETGALLVIRNDSIMWESYWDDFSQNSLSGSFSVAKSITSLLVGMALQEGKIKSIEQPVRDFLPAFTGQGKDSVRIKHLLTMSSGTNFSESYINPFSITAEMYYGANLERTALDVKMETTPGALHRYKSGDTQLLGLVLEKATGQSLASYAAQKLWMPLGAESKALWSTDRAGGHAKAYCCFNSNARDFARIGSLMLHQGNWKGQQLIDSAWVQASGTACMITDDIGKPCHYYGYQWWVAPDFPGVFYARGILGQYIIIIPSLNTVVVRLGRIKSPVWQNQTPALIYKLMDWLPTLP
ncbi:MAG: beta-lactamase family protein [Chitinophagaceae bacterium]|jgi:CubicO group peptidase (beta-lactamase class C family)|nr:beta-lactamase family protein [Chitinophagaceae bacterium]